MTHMKHRIDKAVVVGAGTMGAALAAHLANAGVPVTLLDIVPEGAAPGDKKGRDRLAAEGWERCMQARPANLMASELRTLVRIGNLEDDFQAIGEADWILEAIVEDLKIKQSLMARIDQACKPDAIISTNTSGIPVRDIAAGRSKNFKRHFLGTHFFNPPRYLKLLEVIATPDTARDVVDFMAWFGEYRLGKGVVLCKDTPNFIGNRLAFGTGAFGLDYILENGYSVEEVDAITGPLMGRPKTATFRLIDLVGVDVWDHVGRNLGPLIPHDRLAQAYLSAERPNRLIETMVQRKWLGNKTGTGFYKEARGPDGAKEFWPLDLHSLQHVQPTKPRFESVSRAREAERLLERLEILLAAEDRAGQLARALIYQGLQYASSLLPEVANSPRAIDDAIRWGFQHEAGPFETWDMLGVSGTAERMRACGYPPAEWVQAMLQAGVPSFYEYEGGQVSGAYDLSRGGYVRLKPAAGAVLLRGRPVISQNAGARLVDLGEGVACVEFITKMNTLDDDVMNLLIEAMDRAGQDFAGLVIGGEAPNFSAGANLFPIVVGAQQGMWDMLEAAVRKLQDLNMRMRYFPKPIVAATAGLTLGGGCEIAMHASRVVAHVETYIGLVELGAGVIPAGGGTKEILRRLVNPLMRVENNEALPVMQQAFLQIGQARVSTSAQEAGPMALLGPADRLVMNRDHLLAAARREVLHMSASGFCPPAPEPVYAAGRDLLGALRVGTWMFREGGYITEYDRHLAGKLAEALCGGELSRPQWVSEQYVLDLEREAFLSLCGEEKTQARMWSILQTGKPLRN